MMSACVRARDDAVHAGDDVVDVDLVTMSIFATIRLLRRLFFLIFRLLMFARALCHVIDAMLILLR